MNAVGDIVLPTQSGPVIGHGVDFDVLDEDQNLMFVSRASRFRAGRARSPGVAGFHQG